MEQEATETSSVTVEQALGEQEMPEPVIEIETGATEEAETTETVETAEEKTETVDKAAESSPDSENEVATVPAAVMHGERDRRQKAELKVAELTAQLEEKAKPERPSVLEDEAGFADSVQGGVDQGVMNTLLNEGLAEATTQHGPELVAEAYQWFEANAKTSPLLVNEVTDVGYLRQHRKIVDLFQADKARAEQQEDPAAYEARIGLAAVEKYKAGLETKEKDKEKLRKAVPKTLVGEPSDGALSGNDWNGPTPLESILPE